MTPRQANQTFEITGLIPAAGLGTRMFPATKEMPKEMLPVPSPNKEHFVFKPFLQLVFEELYSAGVRQFVFVVGRGKRILQDHFLPDWELYETLLSKGKKKEATALESFYKMIESSTIIWVDQPHPKGLGDAVLRGLRAVNTEYTLLHLGDILVTGENGLKSIVPDMLAVYKRIYPECDAIIHSMAVKDPQNYGIIVPKRTLTKGTGLIDEVVEVEALVEKPKDPPSNFAISGVYLLPAKKLLESLLETPKNQRTGELEVTDGIQTMMLKGTKLCAGISYNVRFLDIGRPERYLETLKLLANNISRL